MGKRNTFHLIDELAAKHSLELSDKLEGKLTFSDMGLYLAAIAARGIKSSEDAKALIKFFTISLNSLYNHMVKSNMEVRSESLPSQEEISAEQ